MSCKKSQADTQLSGDMNGTGLFFLWGSLKQNRQNPVALEIVRSPSKATGLFFWRKYWAECEKSGRPPFGGYNIIREDECTGRSPWRSLQHCTGAPRPNGNRKTLVPDPGGRSVPASV